METSLTALTPHTAPKRPEASEGFIGSIVDVINPLQHIPFVSELYRSVTGDTIAPAAQIAGGALFGGALGAASSAVSAMVTVANGGESLLATTGGKISAAFSDEQHASSVYAPAEAIALTPDRGEALTAMINEGVHMTTPTPLPAPTASGERPPFRDFREARPLGVQNDTISTQLSAALTAKAASLIV
jgi:hypothetical protein